MASTDLDTRVAHLEQALLKLCAATMDLVTLPPPTGVEGLDAAIDVAKWKAVNYVREAAEIVSGEHAPKE